MVRLLFYPLAFTVASTIVMKGGRMTKFGKGDEVQVTFKAKVTNVSEDGDRLWVHHEGVSDTYLNVGDVKLVKPADDPSTDPIGTVREWSNYSCVRSDYDAAWPWIMLTRDGANGHDSMHGSKVVGAAPSTPAWEAWRLGTLRGAPPFPFIDVEPELELWSGDGSEEPPAHVKKVRDKDGDTLMREGESKWRGSGDSGYSGHAKRWDSFYFLVGEGPWTEARDS